jgi:hypothetical protein
MFFPPTCKGRSMAQISRSGRVITEFEFAQSRKDEVRRPRLPIKGPLADEQSVIAPMSRTSRAISAFREDVPRQPSWHIGANRVNYTSERRRRVVLRPSLDIEHAITRWIHMPAIHPSPWQGQRESKKSIDASLVVHTSSIWEVIPVDVPMLDSLVDLERMVKQSADFYVRYAEGWDADRERGSKNHESGIEMLALSVNPLSPELCWTRPLTDWLARQLCQFKHLFGEYPKRKGWIAHGNNAGRGAGLRSAFHPGRVSGEAFGCLAGK